MLIVYYYKKQTARIDGRSKEKKTEGPGGPN